MADTTFVDKTGNIETPWLQDVNDWTYGVTDKAAAVLIAPEEGAKLFVNSSDGGIFKAVVNSSGYSDNGGAYCGTQFIPTGGDGSTAWVRVDGGYNVGFPTLPSWFGAVGDGIVDDYLAIKAHVEYCEDNGKVGFYPAGTYYSSGWIPITKPIIIEGAGRGDESSGATSISGTTTFKAGSAVGMFSVISDTASTWLYGVVFRDFAIDCSNIGALGIHLKTVSNSIIENILIARCTSAGIKLNNSNGAQCFFNKINNFQYNAGANVAADASHGILIVDDQNVGSGAVQTIMDNIKTNTKDGDGIRLGGCDNNTIYKQQGVIQAGGTGKAIRFANGNYTDARNNLVFYCNGDIHAESNTRGNRLIHLNSENTQVTIDAGGQLHYEVLDRVNSDLHKTHSYRMSDKVPVSATSINPDGVNAVYGKSAAKWGCIEYADGVTSEAYFNLPPYYFWQNGNITGLELVFSSDTANTSDAFYVNIRASSFQSGSISASEVDESFAISVDDSANRFNKSTLTFTTPLDYVFDDGLFLVIRRLGGDVSDTATGVLEVLSMNILFESDGPDSSGSGPYAIPPPYI
jgi:hypothetical protein